jgi:hypothetical protein
LARPATGLGRSKQFRFEWASLCALVLTSSRRRLLRRRWPTVDAVQRTTNPRLSSSDRRDDTTIGTSRDREGARPREMTCYLTAENAAELVEAASGKTNSEIKQLLARRFPGTEELPMVMALPNGRQVAEPELASTLVGDGDVTPARPAVPPRLAPLAPDRHSLRLSISQPATSSSTRARDAESRCRSGLSLQTVRSSTMAAPMPPPTQSVAKP